MQVHFGSKTIVAFKWHWKCKGVGELVSEAMEEDTVPSDITFYLNGKKQYYINEEGVRIHITPRFPP